MKGILNLDPDIILKYIKQPDEEMPLQLPSNAISYSPIHTVRIKILNIKSP